MQSAELASPASRSERDYLQLSLTAHWTSTWCTSLNLWIETGLPVGVGEMHLRPDPRGLRGRLPNHVGLMPQASEPQVYLLSAYSLLSISRVCTAIEIIHHAAIGNTTYNPHGTASFMLL